VRTRRNWWVIDQSRDRHRTVTAVRAVAARLAHVDAAK